MKRINIDNKELLEVLVENGINITCDENMNMVLTDEDAERLDSVVEEFAPAAACDYFLSIIPEEITTLYQLAEYINSEYYNQLMVNKIIEENGWSDTSHISDYDVCSYGSDKVVLNPDTGIAEVVSLEQE